MLKRDFLFGQVEKITQLLHALGAMKKLDEQAQTSVNQVDRKHKCSFWNSPLIQTPEFGARGLKVNRISIMGFASV